MVEKRSILFLSPDRRPAPHPTSVHGDLGSLLRELRISPIFPPLARTGGISLLGFSIGDRIAAIVTISSLVSPLPSTSHLLPTESSKVPKATAYSVDDDHPSFRDTQPNLLTKYVMGSLEAAPRHRLVWLACWSGLQC